MLRTRKVAPRHCSHRSVILPGTSRPQWIWDIAAQVQLQCALSNIYETPCLRLCTVVNILCRAKKCSSPSSAFPTIPYTKSLETQLGVHDSLNIASSHFLWYPKEATMEITQAIAQHITGISTRTSPYLKREPVPRYPLKQCIMLTCTPRIWGVLELMAAYISVWRVK